MGKELHVRMDIHIGQHIDDMKAFKNKVAGIAKNFKIGGPVAKQLAYKDLEELRLHYARAEQVGRKALRLWRDNDE